MRLEHDSYVYFVEVIGEDRVKVGVSSNPYSRVTLMRNRYKLELRLLGAFPGGPSEAARVKNEFTGLAEGAHLNGEWFRYSVVYPHLEFLFVTAGERFPRKLTEEEILVRAKMEWGTEEERAEASEAWALMRKPENRGLSLDEIRAGVGEQRKQALLERFYGSKGGR